jgi:hypothetical protein
MSVGLLACNSKPAESTVDNQTASEPSQAAPQAPAAKAPAGKKMAEMKPKEEPKPQPVVVPAGTVLTVRLGDAVGSKISQSGQAFTVTQSGDQVEFKSENSLIGHARFTSPISLSGSR